MKPDTLIDLVELHTTYKSEFSKKRIHDIIHQFLDQTPVSETHPSLSALSPELISTPKGIDQFYKLWTDALNGKNGFDTVEGVLKEHPSLSARSAELIDTSFDKNNQNYSVVIEDMVKHLTLITAELTSLTVIK